MNAMLEFGCLFLVKGCVRVRVPCASWCFLDGARLLLHEGLIAVVVIIIITVAMRFAMGLILVRSMAVAVVGCEEAKGCEEEKKVKKKKRSCLFVFFGHYGKNAQRP